VIVGRGCLGKPWLFRDLAHAFDGRDPPDPPDWGEVSDVMLEHARRLVDWFGPQVGMLRMRKQAIWYSKGFPGGAALRARLTRVDTVEDLAQAASMLPPGEPFPPSAVRVRRGKAAGTQRVALPDGYLDDLDDDTPPCAAAALAVDGG